jgi:AraC family transcriptional regulator of adaptative response/methylated-DNA-[protein]-cysteine methyltransferase
VVARDRRVPLVRAVCGLIDAHPDQPARLATLADRVGTTPHQLLRAFRGVLGISPRQYRDARRLDRFKAGLRAKGRVSPALYDAGYGSPSRVYERAHVQLGMTPATYSRGAPDTVITFSVVASPLGRLLVAATERGICRISLGDDGRALEESLREEFPAAAIRRDSGALAAWVGAILRYLDGRAEPLDLPLDVRATAFQRHVWETLRTIPYGTTRSYSEVARAIGRPRASRAVARACATNPAALVIPCQRVIREDGGLGGYRWGVGRKRALLEREARRAQG